MSTEKKSKKVRNRSKKILFGKAGYIFVLGLNEENENEGNDTKYL